MPDRSSDRAPAGPSSPPRADLTRDIRLPRLPNSPGPAVRPEWAAYVPVEEQPRPAPAAPAPPAPAPDSTATAPTVVTGDSDAPVAPPTTPDPTTLDPPTDRLAGPTDRARSSTLSFQPPPPVQLLKVSVGPRRRSQWLWAVLIMLPLLIIAGSGIWLFVLLNGG